MLEWARTMEVGHFEFDRDHRQLIAMTNLLADALQLANGHQALSLAGELRTKADLHCQREERELTLFGVDWSPVVAAHRRVADLATAVRLAVQNDNLAVAESLMAVLEESLAIAVMADRSAFAAKTRQTRYDG